MLRLRKQTKNIIVFAADCVESNNRQYLASEKIRPVMMSSPGKKLIRAATAGYYNRVHRLLLKNDIDVNSQDRSGSTSIHRASWMGHANIVECLIAHNADISCKDKLGNTPLHYACRKGRFDIVKLIVGAGTGESILLNNNEGKTAVDEAREENYREIVDYLMKSIRKKSKEIKYQEELLALKKEFTNLKELYHKEINALHEELNEVKKASAVVHAVVPTTNHNNSDVATLAVSLLRNDVIQSKDQQLDQLRQENETLNKRIIELQQQLLNHHSVLSIDSLLPNKVIDISNANNDKSNVVTPENNIEINNEADTDNNKQHYESSATSSASPPVHKKLKRHEYLRVTRSRKHPRIGDNDQATELPRLVGKQMGSNSNNYYANKSLNRVDKEIVCETQSSDDESDTDEKPRLCEGDHTSPLNFQQYTNQKWFNDCYLQGVTCFMCHQLIKNVSIKRSVWVCEAHPFCIATVCQECKYDFLTRRQLYVSNEE